MLRQIAGIRRLSSLLALAMALTVAAPAALASPQGGSQGNACNPVKRAAMVAFAKLYVQIFNLRNPALFPIVLSQDVVLDSTVGYFNGLAEVAGVMSAVYAAIPDLTYTIDEILVDGDSFVLRYSYSGTHLGELFGFPPTGQVISCTGLEIDRVKNGKIVHTSNFTDANCLLTSLAGQ